ncbi:hypothetical protein YC2023_032215 [Brassica napus]
MYVCICMRTVHSNTALINQPNFSSVATHASSLLHPDVLRLASLLLPPQQPLQNFNPIYAPNLDQNIQTPITTVSSQDSQLQAECTTPVSNNETSSFDPFMKARLELKVKGGSKKTTTDRESKMMGKDCQLMGLTWLLARNKTVYIPTVSAKSHYV